VYLLKRWRIGLLGVLVSAIAIAFIISQFDAGEFVRAMSSARWIYVLLCAILLLVALLPRAKRWQVLLGDALPYWRAFNIMNVAYLVNNVLPLRIGEVARMYLATQSEPPVPAFKTLSTVVVERLLDLLAVVFLLGFALLAGDVPVPLRTAGGTAAMIALGGFLFLVFLASRRTLAERLMRFFMEHVSILARLKVDRWLASFLDGLTPITAPRTLAQVLFWTALSWGISVFAGYILMFAFYEGADHLAVTCLYIASAAFAIAVPAVPGNLGTYELSIIAALTAFGFGTDQAVVAAFAVVVHGVNLVTHFGAGVYGFVQEGISIERLSQGVQEIRQQSS
jgi:uncharacterized protein (TIRG00374 family)